MGYFWAEKLDEMGAAEVVPHLRPNPPVHQLKRLLCMCLLAFTAVKQDLLLVEVETVANDQFWTVPILLVIFDAAMFDNATPDSLLNPFLVV